MFQLALAVSALVAMIALKWTTFRGLFWLSVVPEAVGLVLTFPMIEPSVHDRSIETNVVEHLREAVAAFVRDHKLRLLAFASALGFAIGEAKYLFYPAFFALFWHDQALAFARLLS